MFYLTWILRLTVFCPSLVLLMLAIAMLLLALAILMLNALFGASIENVYGG